MSQSYTLFYGEEKHTVTLIPEGEGYRLSLEDGETAVWTPLWQQGPAHIFQTDNLQKIETEVIFQKDACTVFLNHVPYAFEVFDARRASQDASHGDTGGSQGLISAPMPGKVVDVKVKVGDEVQKGQALVIVEAMKMQNELHASISGKVVEVAVKIGDTVESGQKLLTVEKTDQV